MDQTPRDRDVLSCEPNKAAAHATMANQVACYVFGRVNGCGEADALSRQDDGCIDADDLCSRVDEWPPRVPWIQSGVSLNNIVQQSPRLRPQRPAECADHSSGHRTLETVRVAYCHYQLAHTYGPGLSKLNRDQVGGINPEDGEVRIRVITDQLSLVTGLLRQRDIHFGCAMHH